MHLNKWEKMERLKRMGLNSPDAILLTSPEDLIPEGWLSPGKLSIRSFTPKEYSWNDPFFPNIDSSEVLEKVAGLLRTNHHVILQRGVNPKDTVCCGTVEIHEEGYPIKRHYHFEVLNGPGTVRDVMRNNAADQHVVLVAGDSQYTCLNAVIAKLRTRGSDQEMFEFSVYPYGVGRLDEKVIFWEVHDL